MTTPPSPPPPPTQQALEWLNNNIPKDIWAIFEDLATEEEDFQRVAAAVKTSKADAVVVGVLRFHNTILKQKYNKRMERMEANRGADGAGANEKTLFHGTTLQNIVSISSYGFDPSKAKRCACGKGIYFSSVASTSYGFCAETFGNKYMFLARVLVGDSVLGTSNSLPAQKAAGKSTVSEVYDTSVNNMTNPQVFVTHSDDQAYPEYLIVLK